MLHVMPEFSDADYADADEAFEQAYLEAKGKLPEHPSEAGLASLENRLAVLDKRIAATDDAGHLQTLRADRTVLLNRIEEYRRKVLRRN